MHRRCSCATGPVRQSKAVGRTVFSVWRQRFRAAQAPQLGLWSVQIGYYLKRSVANVTEWGTDRVAAVTALMSGRARGVSRRSASITNTTTAAHAAVTASQRQERDDNLCNHVSSASRWASCRGAATAASCVTSEASPSVAPTPAQTSATPAHVPRKGGGTGRDAGLSSRPYGRVTHYLPKNASIAAKTFFYYLLSLVPTDAFRNIGTTSRSG